MPKLEMRSAGGTPQQAPLALAHSAPPPSQAPAISGIGTIESVRQEVEDAYEDARTFFNREPDEVIRLVSGHCARLSYLRMRVGEIEAVNRQWRPTFNALTECLEELRNQFNYASRLLFSRELDWKIETGGRQT